jgi:hypothetical protein
VLPGLGLSSPARRCGFQVLFQGGPYSLLLPSSQPGDHRAEQARRPFELHVPWLPLPRISFHQSQPHQPKLGAKVTAYRVARLEPGTLMLWNKPGGSWLWVLEPDGAGCMRLITRLCSRYAWAKPTIMTELILMEIGAPRSSLRAAAVKVTRSAPARPRQAVGAEVLPARAR